MTVSNRRQVLSVIGQYHVTCDELHEAVRWDDHAVSDLNWLCYQFATIDRRKYTEKDKVLHLT